MQSALVYEIKHVRPHGGVREKKRTSTATKDKAYENASPRLPNTFQLRTVQKHDTFRLTSNFARTRPVMKIEMAFLAFKTTPHCRSTGDRFQSSSLKLACRRILHLSLFILHSIK